MINKDDLMELLNLLNDYKGRVLGILLGFIIALLIIRFGIILSIFIIICVGIGYYLGMRYDNKQDFKDLINDILPNNE
ncbi:DUF2273 domain-containing protein [Orenia metallireducens]|nr:DUF2273 domain-containing protein [Orenia metallireducens]